MNILEKMQQLQAFAIEFVKRKSYRDNLLAFQIENQRKEVERLKAACDFAERNRYEATIKLDKYELDLVVLNKWLPEHQKEYESAEAANSKQVQKLAEKVQKQYDELGADQTLLQ